METEGDRREIATPLSDYTTLPTRGTRQGQGVQIEAAERVRRSESFSTTWCSIKSMVLQLPPGNKTLPRPTVGIGYQAKLPDTTNLRTQPGKDGLQIMQRHLSRPQTISFTSYIEVGCARLRRPKRIRSCCCSLLNRAVGTQGSSSVPYPL